MYIASCPLRISLFGGSTDNPYFVEKYGRGSVISFTSNLKTYVTISQDKFGYQKHKHRYIINYSKREEVSRIEDIQNEVVRTVLEYYNMPPVQVTLTSDAYSQGSGLASSSSYTISLIKACCLFLNKSITDNDACKLAYKLERIYNPYCGYQDPYGCGVGGFKRINFMGDNSVTYEFLSTDIFERYDTHLVFTGVTRNSKKILQNITENLDKVQPLLDTCDDAYQILSEQNCDGFLSLLNKSWHQKKLTSSSVTENDKIKEIDSVLENNETVCAHKLCGAGNGGFFLCFSKINTLKIPYEYVKINVESNGVVGKIL
jgi:D-glycero-alpha-D-manno-heptose-7-phosphate kinase